MEKALKLGMSILLVVLLLLPLTQQYLSFSTVKPLSGDIAEVQRPDFTWDSCIKGAYQQQRDEYWKANFGFQPFFIRLNNQVHYSIYNEIKAKNVIEGKNGYLYEANYIRALLGIDFIGNDLVKETTQDLQQLRTFLNANGSELLILLAPGKGSFYPEFIPEEYQKIAKQKTNYEAYLKALASTDIPTLDFKAWFEELKTEVNYPLFPQAGIHWSKYGEYRAADSLLRYINANQLAQVGKTKLKGIHLSNENKDGDYDIGEGMNLLWSLSTFPMAYPDYHFVGDDKADRVLVISDSYYWGLFNRGMSKNCFGNGSFWFYNDGIYPESFESEIRTHDVDYKKELLKNKLVIIVSTDANLYRFPFGVTECFK